MGIRLKKIAGPGFSDIYKIMEEAFPKDEIRTYEKQLELLDNPSYNLYGSYYDGKLCGLVGEWVLSEVNFIEHLAVSENLRSKGLGSQIMDSYISMVRRPIILEVEDKDEPTANRRKSFYRRLGFETCDITYKQPGLQEEKYSDIMLRIMHYPASLPPDVTERAADEIFKKIYRAKRS